MIRVYIPGVWDLLHVGHINVLEWAKALGDQLVVGVPSDAVVMEDKGWPPIIPLEQRIKMLSALRCVDLAIPYYSLSFIRELCWLNPTMLVVGEPWGAEARHREAEQWVKDNGKQLVRLPRTEGVSTTLICQKVQGRLCHSSPENDYRAFCDGCDEYQIKLFGKCRSNELEAMIHGR